MGVHPDTQVDLEGKELTCARDAVEMCVDAHRRLMPNVPTIGWDVGVADGHGAVLLEANLSCNFFGGSYDRQRYLRIVDTYFACDGRPGPSHYNVDFEGEGKSDLSTSAPRTCTEATNDDLVSVMS